MLSQHYFSLLAALGLTFPSLFDVNYGPVFTNSVYVPTTTRTSKIIWDYPPEQRSIVRFNVWGSSNLSQWDLIGNVPGTTTQFLYTVIGQKYFFRVSAYRN